MNQNQQKAKAYKAKSLGNQVLAYFQEYFPSGVTGHAPFLQQPLSTTHVFPVN